MPPKVFDTLCLLVENHGNILSKEEMLDEIWKDTFVEENNLSQNISALRKIFGKEKTFIETVPTKGFRFVKPVKFSSMERYEEANANGNYIIATQTQTQIVEESFENEITKPIPRESIGNNRKYIFAIAFTALIEETFGGLFFYSSSGKTKRTIPSASFDYEELTDTGNINSSAISPDGNFVAFTKLENLDDENRLTLNLLDIESRNSVEVKIENNIVPGFLQFSLDEKSIYFRTRVKKIQFQNVYKISKFGGFPKLIAKDVWGNFSISPDGEKLSYLGRNP